MSRVFVVVLVLATIAPACGRIGFSQPRTERFEFVTEAGLGRTAEAQRMLEKRLTTNDPTAGTLVDGTAEHLATIDVSGGTVDAFAWEEIDSDGARVACNGTFAPSGAGYGCGPVTEDRSSGLPEPLFVDSVGFGDSWADATLRTDPDIARISATADDGTMYSVIPREGVAYIEWPIQRGDLRLTALAEDGTEITTADVPIDP